MNGSWWLPAAGECEVRDCQRGPFQRFADTLASKNEFGCQGLLLVLRQYANSFAYGTHRVRDGKLGFSFSIGPLDERAPASLPNTHHEWCYTFQSDVTSRKESTELQYDVGVRTMSNPQTSSPSIAVVRMPWAQGWEGRNGRPTKANLKRKS